MIHIYQYERFSLSNPTVLLPLVEVLTYIENSIKPILLPKLQCPIFPPNLRWIAVRNPPRRHSLRTRSINPGSQFSILNGWPWILPTDKIDKVFCVCPRHLLLRVSEMLIEVLEQIGHIENMAGFVLEAAFPRYAFVEVVEKELRVGRVWPALGKGADRSIKGDLGTEA